jgi:UDP-glucose 4-epimerase
MEIQGKRFLVIGGAGFIGSHVVSELLRHDVKEVVIYDNFARGKVSNISINSKTLDAQCLKMVEMFETLIF